MIINDNNLTESKFSCHRFYLSGSTFENDKKDEIAGDILRQGLGWLVIHNRFGAAATLTPLY